MVKASSEKREYEPLLDQEEGTDDQESSRDKVILKLLVMNKDLTDELIVVNTKYYNAFTGNTEELKLLRKTIQDLKDKLDRINKARSISFKLPEEIVFED